MHFPSLGFFLRMLIVAIKSVFLICIIWKKWNKCTTVSNSYQYYKYVRHVIYIWILVCLLITKDITMSRLLMQIKVCIPNFITLYFLLTKKLCNLFALRFRHYVKREKLFAILEPNVWEAASLFSVWYNFWDVWILSLGKWDVFV